MFFWKKNTKEYSEESDAYKANDYSYNCICVTVIIVGISWVLNLFNIFIVDQILMNIGFIGTGVAWGIAIIMRHTLNYEKKSTGYLMLFLLIVMFTFINTVLTYHGTMFFVLPMLCSLLYNDKMQEDFTYFMLAIGIIVASLGGFYFGLCDANMLILTTGNSALYVNALQTGIKEINQDPLKIVLFFAAPKIVALTAFKIIASYIKREIAYKTTKEIESRRLAETDALTGIYNRSKYIDSLEVFEKNNNRVAVIYADVNNLKMINDSKGHEFGDILILGLANILKEMQSDKSKAYRIGGDEFVMLVANPMKNELDSIVDEIRKQVCEAKLENDLVLSVAIGTAEGKGKQIKELVSEADEKMYENKAQMKQMK